MLQRKPLEQRLKNTKLDEPNNTIPHQTNETLKERQKTYPKIVQALATTADKIYETMSRNQAKLDRTRKL